MKTHRLFGLILLTISLCLSACSEIDAPVEPTPDPKPDEVKSEIIIDDNLIANGLSFTNEVGEKSVSFTTNEDWTLSISSTSNSETWCTASTTSGAKGEAMVKFAVTENTSYDDRSVSVTIKSGTASKAFSITQKYAGALLLTANKYEVKQEGGTIDIEVKANIDYKMEIADNAKEWITETKTRALTAYKHTLNVSANTNAGKREGEIYFKSGDKIDTVTVHQIGNAYITLSKNEYTLDASGHTITIEIRSNVEYEIQMPDVDWITGFSHGTSSHYLECHIAPNEEYESRYAEIIFYDKNSDLKETLKVIQGPKDAFILEKDNIIVEKEGGIVEIKVKTNMNLYSIGTEISDSWISQVETRTFTEHSIYFSIEENTGVFERSATIYLWGYADPSNTDWIPVTITQKCCSDFELAVTLEEAGTLKKTIGDNYKEITSLKITGPINGDDVYDLRKMLGNTNVSETNRGKLKKLDLSNASIVEGGGCYYIDAPQYYTSDNILGESMFSDCENLQEIILPKNITTISRCAFYSCNHLEKVSMFEGVRSIGEYAFNYCCLTSIQIPSTLTNIGRGAFDGGVTGSNTSVYITDLEAWFNIYFYWWTSNPLSPSGGKLYLNGEEVTELTVPEGVTKINSFAFYGCSSIKKMVIGEGVSSISAGAFFKCTSLTEIYSYATTPPEIIERLNYSTDAFDYDIRYNATLYVPERCGSKYSVWGFDNIVEME